MYDVLLARLHETIAELANVDADTLTDAELDAVVVGLQRARHRLAGAGAGLLARWDSTAVWAGDGSRSAAARLSRDAGTSLTTARVELRRARRLTAMPAAAAAVTDGRVSMDAVDLLAHADQPHRHDLFVRDETLLVGMCADLRHAQATNAVNYWCQQADTATGHDTYRPEPTGNRCHASTLLDGTLRLDALLDAISGEIVRSELDRLEHELYLADQAAGITRTTAERYAAALVEMAVRSASTPADAQRPRPLFSVVVGDDSFTRLCELASGTILSPGLLVPWLGVAEMETIVFDGPITIVGTTRRRTFTGKLRRAIQIRDRHCQHPSGCDVPAARCDVDHIVPYSQGGKTSQFNGAINCRPHNRDSTKHHHGTPAKNVRSPTSTPSARASAGKPATNHPPTETTTSTNQSSERGRSAGTGGQPCGGLQDVERRSEAGVRLSQRASVSPSGRGTAQGCRRRPRRRRGRRDRWGSIRTRTTGPGQR